MLNWAYCRRESSGTGFYSSPLARTQHNRGVDFEITPDDETATSLATPPRSRLPTPHSQHARTRLTCPVSLISIDSVAAWACSNCLRTETIRATCLTSASRCTTQNRGRHLPSTIFRRDRVPSQTEVRKERTRKVAEKSGALTSQILSPCQVCGKHQSLQGQTELGGTRLLRKRWCCRPHPYVGPIVPSLKSLPLISSLNSWTFSTAVVLFIMGPRTSSARAAEQLPKRFRVPSREPYQDDRGMLPMAPAPKFPLR